MTSRILIIALAVAGLTLGAASAASAATRSCTAPVGVHNLTVSGARRATCFGARALARQYRDDGAVSRRVTRYRGASGSRITCTRGSRVASTGDLRVSCVVAYRNGARARIRFAIEP